MGRDSTRGRLDRRTGVQGRIVARARSGPDRHGASARAKFRGVRKPIAARPGRLWHGASGGRAAGQQVRWAPGSSAVGSARSEPRLPPPGSGGHELASLDKLLSAPALNVLSPCLSCGLSEKTPHGAMQRFLFVATLVAALPTPRRRVRAPSRIRSSPRGGGGRIADSRSTTLPRDSRSTILPRGAAAIAASRSRSSRRRRASTAALTKTQENRITQARY